MRRIESGAILKPINVYNPSSCKRPDERKPRTQNPNANTYTNSSKTQNRRGSYRKPTETTKNWTQGSTTSTKDDYDMPDTMTDANDKTSSACTIEESHCSRRHCSHVQKWDYSPS
ncbi:hypothetical protein GNI_142390 [Gregarina niphandrodes]|uniref:Uncharacterized protein n=1 Tax=Gregarina niphandrodes TaxID=110365 RepID=A0A023B059_GRENI|nr:hypothetical protein GNI_142390 [Gregarina niphandrodes]EZG44950.1 hypothetical protein GNI_142390 [Gregarina niphandrodes]|eukprot:XP_011132618.1 hypothetical protein GNI_142390 [Gregarina niphandrodes]